MTNEQTTNEKTTNDLNTNLFPRSTAYDEAWVTANRMGPNVLWLAESIAERMLRAVEREAVDRACIRLTLNNRTDRESYERGFYPREGFRLTARTPFQATSACSQASGKVPIQLQWSAQAPSSPCVSMTWSSWRSMCSRKLA